MWLSGYELADTLCVFCANFIYVLARQRKVQFLQPVVAALGKRSDLPDLQMTTRIRVSLSIFLILSVSEPSLCGGIYGTVSSFQWFSLPLSYSMYKQLYYLFYFISRWQQKLNVHIILSQFMDHNFFIILFNSFVYLLFISLFLCKHFRTANEVISIVERMLENFCFFCFCFVF